MELALVIVLLLFTLQALAKFAIWVLVPYETRIKRIAATYAKGPGALSRFDTISVVVVVAMVVLLFLTDMRYLSFVTGLVAGMVLIQVFFHRFNRVLPDEKAPESPAPPIKQISYAIQAQPFRAWLEIAVMTVLFGWALYMLVSRGLFG